MRTVSMIVLSLALAAGCGDKDESAGNAAVEPANPATPTPTTPAGPRPTLAPPPETPPPLRPLPAGLPTACQEAEVTVRRIVTCNKIDVSKKVVTAKSWNGAVDGAYVDYDSQPEKNKARIESGCAKMVENSKPLLEGCP